MIEVQTLRHMGLGRLRTGRDDLNLLLVCVCVCVCVCLSVCLRACVYPEPNSVTETGLGWAYFPPGHVLSSEMDKHPFETYIRVLTIHHHRYKSRHIATSHSPSTVDARFDEHPLETHIKGSTPHQNQPFPI